MKKIFVYILILAACLVTACNHSSLDPDPTPDPDNDTIKEQIEALKNNAPSVKYMYRGQVDSVWIGVDFPIEYNLFKVASEKGDDSFAYTTQKGTVIYLSLSEDIPFFQRGQYLVASTEVPSDAASMYVLALFVKGSEEKVAVQLPVRSINESEATNGAQNDADAARNARAADILRHPILFDIDGASVNNAVVWLNKDAVLYGMSKNDSNNKNGVTIPAIISTTKGASTRKYESKGSTVDKDSKSTAHEVGIGLKIPIISNIFSFSASVKHTKKESEQTEREWYRWSVHSSAMSASIDKTMLIAHPEYYITEELNNVLNSTDPKVLAKYPMDTTGTMKLLDDFGLFMSTTGSFGAYCMYQYERQANVSTLDIGVEAKSSFTKAEPGHNPETVEQALLFYMTVAFGIDVNKETKQFNAAVGSEESKYRKAVKSSTTSVRYGGNCLTENDVTKWNATDNPDNWNLLSFSANGDYNEEGSNLVSILDLATYSKEDLQNKNKRIYWLRQVLTGADGQLMGSDCQYAKSRYALPVTDNRAVLADVYLMVNTPEQFKDPKETFENQPKILVMKDPDGVEHVYQPLIINKYAGDMVNGLDNNPSMEGYGFLMGYDDSNRNKYSKLFNFITGEEGNWGGYDKFGRFQKRTLVIYYALDDWKHCSGVDDILIGNCAKDNSSDESDPLDFLDGYVRRGGLLSDAFFLKAQTSPGDDFDDAGIYVKYVPKKDRSKNYPYVTGFGLVAGSDQTPQLTINWRQGWPFATTSGTELTLTDNSVYNYYWDPKNADDLYISIPVREKKVVYNCKVKDVENIYHDTDINMIFKVGDNTVKTWYRPALFTHWGRYCCDQDKRDHGRDKIYLNYTRKKIDEDHRTEPRQPKLFPYHVEQ